MAAYRGLLLPLGFLGAMFLIMFSFDLWDMSQEKRAGRMQQLQELRKQLTKEICDGDKEAFSEGKHSLEDLSDKELKHLIVDDTHGLIYCYIPKAKLKHYTKFMFVRDPFVRLISAYRDKFLRSNKYYYKNFARDILRLYGNRPDPPQTVDEAFVSGVHPSFYNFIEYLLDPLTEKRQPFEPHWRQMHRLCHPCHIQYDFIGHQETLQEDAEHLLRILKLQDDIKFPPSYENMTSPGSVMDWFRAVPLEDRRKLYKLYEGDFRLFGYRKPSELLDG
ncbi:carbohydrate sulfotransferase 12-like isoform X6 [Seriola dumerili]|uniref:carbohydrate sulfotransferase 12-like isoform X6 n=1 Tax=Seriola dumerili TaxID=41447 RepID=UPI000BBEDF61|nr:carbohydrate sulfotransferase 12-like isoform X6 [Seriola dumerili]